MSLGLSAAFKTVDHDILIARLDNRVSITDIVLSWCKLYLTNHNVFVYCQSQTFYLRCRNICLLKLQIRSSPNVHRYPEKNVVAAGFLIQELVCLNQLSPCTKS